MKRLTLSKRLAAAASWVPQGARLCDVGTDHAALPIWLTREGRLASALATDIRPGPLDRARRSVERYGCGDSVALRLCDGLSSVSPEEADTVTICGMGGNLIRSILEAAPWTREGTELILQPQKSQDELRRWLSKQNYRVLSERVLWEEGHWYTLLQVRGGASDCYETAGELLVGLPRHWCREDDWQGFLTDLKARLTRQKTGLERSERGADPARLEELRGVLTQIDRWCGLLERGVWPE